MQGPWPSPRIGWRRGDEATASRAFLTPKFFARSIRWKEKLACLEMENKWRAAAKPAKMINPAGRAQERSEMEHLDKNKKRKKIPPAEQELDRQYHKIGISAVAAAVCYQREQPHPEPEGRHDNAQGNPAD